MDMAKTAREVLAEAERRLRELVGQAASAGEYEAVDRITDWAKTLGSLARNGAFPPARNNVESVASSAFNAAGANPAMQRSAAAPVRSTPGAHSGLTVTEAQPATTADGHSQPGNGASAEDLHGLGETPRSANGHGLGLPLLLPETRQRPSRPTGHRKDARQSAQSTRRKVRKGEYPKFFREGDYLVKVGWSKKAREEYQHKAPRRVIDALAAAIARATESKQSARSGRLFTTEDLFTQDRPLKDPTTGEDIPGYQAYVALAWMKMAGVVKQVGRRGYAERNGAHILDAAVTAWQAIEKLKE